VPVQVKTKPRLAPPTLKEAVASAVPDTAPDPLTKLASAHEGPSLLGDSLASASETSLGPSLASNELTGASSAVAAKGGEAAADTQTLTSAPAVGGAGADPLKWVMGASAPSIGGLRMLALDLDKEAMAHNKRAPKTPEGNAFHEAVRDFQNELGQFSALCSLAKLSDNWQAVGMHAATQLTDALAKVASLVEAVVERPSSDLPGRVQSDVDRLRAGRQVYLSGSAPFEREQDPKRRGFLG
jgi:hypothetical protein